MVSNIESPSISCLERINDGRGRPLPRMTGLHFRTVLGNPLPRATIQMHQIVLHGLGDLPWDSCHAKVFSGLDAVSQAGEHHLSALYSLYERLSLHFIRSGFVDILPFLMGGFPTMSSSCVTSFCLRKISALVVNVCNSLKTWPHPCLTEAETLLPERPIIQAFLDYLLKQ